ncbi:MAG: DNA-3-methyladenine glycosidase [Deltaproteobacteria bacterium]|nr:MAG: DNA-3-methyladenine glycosidase [Deltaproteobacteria bacterium]
MTSKYFKYGQKELNHLKSKDKKLAEIIDKIGMIEREVIPDLFEGLIHTIIGQQISTKAAASIWKKMKSSIPDLTPEIIAEYKPEKLQKIGISFRKVEYMQSACEKILNKSLNLYDLKDMNDKKVCTELTKLRGIGVWSAEMIMIFSMQRQNILSYGDLGIHRGLRMLYHHRSINTAHFKKYWCRYSPYSSVASLYLWEIAGGAVPEMKDYAPKQTKRK